MILLAASCSPNAADTGAEAEGSDGPVPGGDFDGVTEDLDADSPAFVVAASAADLHERATIALDEGRPEEAIELLSEEIDLLGALPDATQDQQDLLALSYVTRATTLWGFGRYDDAVADATAAIELRAGAPEPLPYGVRGFSLTQSGVDCLAFGDDSIAECHALLDLAVEDFTTALELDDGELSAEFHLNRGGALGILERFDESLADAEAALEALPPGTQQADLARMQRVASLVALDRVDEAMPELCSLTNGLTNPWSVEAWQAMQQDFPELPSQC